MDDAPHRPDEAPGPDPMFTPEELRVLGSLIEKSRTTPDDYPLTANALMRATNQTTSRDPVVAYDSSLIERTAAELKAKGYLRFVHTPSGRATTRYRHIVDERLGLDDAQTAVLGLLMLRGAQTVSELRTRAERWHPFTDLESVTSTLRSLADRDGPLVVLLERQPGHKEVRWTHLLLGEPLLPSTTEGVGAGARSAGGERLAALEERVESLEALVAELRAELGLG